MENLRSFPTFNIRWASCFKGCAIALIWFVISSSPALAEITIYRDATFNPPKYIVWDSTPEQNRRCQWLQGGNAGFYGGPPSDKSGCLSNFAISTNTHPFFSDTYNDLVHTNSQKQSTFLVALGLLVWPDLASSFFYVLVLISFVLVIPG